MTPASHDGRRFAATVVTVTFNDDAGLRRTVASVRHQTLRDFEHVVVDGGSKDGSMAWLAANPATAASTVLSEPDAGIYDAMNKGLALARGVLVTFLNSGDTYASADVLQRAVAHQEQYGWEWGHGLARVVDSKGRAMRPLARPTYVWWRHAFGRNTIVHQSIFVLTDRLRAIGGFNIDYPIASDFHSVLKLGRFSRPGLWPETDVEFLAGGLSDRSPGKALWDMHRARCAVFRFRGPLVGLDALWTVWLTLYVHARRGAKILARLVAGQRAVNWWARQ